MSAPGKLTIETPEQVALEFTLASVGSRFLALAVDTLIQTLTIIAGVILFAFGFRGQSLGIWMQAALILALFAVYYGYFAAFEILWAGQTPGKRVIGLRVLNVSGRPLSPYETILRNVVRIADQMPGIYGVGILSVLLTERNQRLGDLAASSVVVHERPIEAGEQEDRQRATRSRHGAYRLVPEEIALIETFFRRRAELNAAARLSASRKIAERIRERLGAPPIDDEEVFLEEVAAEYRADTRFR